MGKLKCVWSWFSYQSGKISKNCTLLPQLKILEQVYNSARTDTKTGLVGSFDNKEHRNFFITNGQCLVQFSESYGVPNRVAHDKMVYISNRLCMNTFELYFILLDMY